MPNLETIHMEGSNLPITTYIRSQQPEERQIVTEAIYECLNLKHPLNRMEICYIVRMLKRKRNLYATVDASQPRSIWQQIKSLLKISR